MVVHQAAVRQAAVLPPIADVERYLAIDLQIDLHLAIDSSITVRSSTTASWLSRRVQAQGGQP